MEQDASWFRRQFFGDSSVANISSCIVAITAVFAAFYAKASIEGQIASNAESAFSEHLALAFENPEYATPFDNFPKGYPEDQIEFEKYDWFVSALLTSAEKVLAAHPNDRKWSDTINQQICYHSNYLKDFYSKDTADRWTKIDKSLYEKIIQKKINSVSRLKSKGTPIEFVNSCYDHFFKSRK